MRLSVEQKTVRLRKPLETAHGTVRERVLVGVTLAADDEGPVGCGEAAPLRAVRRCERGAGARRAERYRHVLADADGLTGVQLIEACRREEDLPQALAAIDMALWDRAGRRADRPVAELLTDSPSAR